MLQFAGSNMDPNDFLINVINKFSLIPWTREDFNCKEDDSIRQVNTLAEEFFSILIYILSERYVPGKYNLQIIIFLFGKNKNFVNLE